MLSREELENIKVGDKIKFDAGWLAYMCTGDSIRIETVVETRVRCGEEGNVFEDYMITDENSEVGYEEVLEVIKD